MACIIATPLVGQEDRPNDAKAPPVPTAAGDTPPPRIINGVPPGFELVRLTNDPTMQHSIPDINDRGEIVFGKFISGTDVWTIHVFSNGVFRQVTPDDAIRLNPAINNAGEMAWYGRDDLEDRFDLYASFSEVPLRGCVRSRDIADKDGNWQGVPDPWRGMLIPAT